MLWSNAAAARCSAIIWTKARLPGTQPARSQETYWNWLRKPAARLVRELWWPTPPTEPRWAHLSGLSHRIKGPSGYIGSRCLQRIVLAPPLRLWRPEKEPG